MNQCTIKSLYYSKHPDRLSYAKNPEMTYIKENFSTYYNENESQYLTNTSTNVFNENFKVKLEKDFSQKFINFILHENIDEDYKSTIEVELINLFRENSYVTRAWLSNLIILYFSEAKFLTNVLKILSKSDFHELFREHLTILGLLLNKDIEVKDCAIRVFESWADKESLRILKESDPIIPEWLESYKQQVINDIESAIIHSV
ncbi:TPA: hypothetical protein ACU8BJ_001920 [Neisseria subflava]